MKNPRGENPNKPLTSSLVPADERPIIISRQEATLIRGFLSRYLRRNASESMKFTQRQALTTALVLNTKLADFELADPGLPAMEDDHFPPGVPVYHFITFDMEDLTDYDSYLPACEELTTYIFSHKRRKADDRLIEMIRTYGNSAARNLQPLALHRILDVNNSGIAFNRRHPDELISVKVARLGRLAPVLSNLPSSDRVMEDFIITE